jgi:hypothetical protein
VYSSVNCHQHTQAADRAQVPCAHHREGRTFLTCTPHGSSCASGLCDVSAPPSILNFNQSCFAQPLDLQPSVSSSPFLLLSLPGVPRIARWGCQGPFPHA